MAVGLKALLFALATGTVLLASQGCGDDLGQWSTRAPMPTPRTDVAIVAWGDLIYVAGGIEADGTVSDKVEVYNPSNDSWTATTPLPETRYGAGAATWNHIVVVGGFDGEHVPQSTVFQLDVETADWSELPELSEPRAAHVTANLHGNPVVAGGVGVSESGEAMLLKSGEWMDAMTEEWHPLEGQLTVARSHAAGASATLSGGGDVLWDEMYVSGGRVGSKHLDLVEAAVFHNEFEVVEAPPTRRSGAAAAGLGNRIYIFGGVDTGGVIDKAEVYDPEPDKSWKVLTPMPTARHGHGAATVDGVIYVIGGSTSEAPSPTGANEAFTP